MLIFVNRDPVSTKKHLKEFRNSNDGRTPLGLLFVTLLEESWSKKISNDFLVEFISWEVRDDHVQSVTRKYAQEIVFSYRRRISCASIVDKAYQLVVKSDELEKAPEPSEVRKKMEEWISTIEKRHEWEIKHLQETLGDLKKTKEQLKEAA